MVAPTLASDSPRQASPTELLQYISRLIVAEIHADHICVCGYRQETGQIDRLANYPDELAPSVRSSLQRRLGSLLTGQYKGVQVLAAEDLHDTGFASALLIPLRVQDSVVGMLALFAHQPDVYSAEDLARIKVPVSLVSMVLENLYLYDTLAQNIIISQLILLTAQTIVDNPSPQQIIDVLRERMFDAHVTSCAILLYGPVSEDRPNGPFDYLEMAGAWSKRRGSAIALGTKIYLEDYPEYLQRLDARETLVFVKELPAFIARLDPFVRSIIRAERIRALTLLPLHAGQRKIGVLLIGSDRPHSFTRQELQNYQTVSEFLGVSAMAQILQQQHDLVQQGRAALLDAVTDGVVMVLPDAGGARVLTVNKRFTGLFGVPEHEAQGLLLPQLLAAMQIPEGVRQELDRSWLSIAVRDPGTQRGEFHMVHSEGYPLDIEWYSAPVYQETRVLGRIYTFHDVTAERMAVRVRSAFLSRVSHELRTPLTSIHGFAEFILEAAGDELPPLAREYTEIILNSARHLRAVFTDMIEMTRAEAGELKLNFQRAHFPDVIISVAAQLELQYKRRAQAVVLELDDDLPAVNMDVDRIIQVLSNLLGNAIKFSPENSTIRVSTQTITCYDDLPASAPPDVLLPCILVRVIDQGVGISKDDLDQIFVPFFRTEWARQHKIEGTGTGLAVARSIIELHRGKIWAEASTPTNPGGRFLFSLPTA
ncbi:MAG TPA: ATP-binding protein [Spirillospora sp.]|nr:ATP-binding protein [Spirillospora sp.]